MRFLPEEDQTYLFKKKLVLGRETYEVYREKAIQEKFLFYIERPHHTVKNFGIGLGGCLIGTMVFIFCMAAIASLIRNNGDDSLILLLGIFLICSPFVAAFVSICLRFERHFAFYDRGGNEFLKITVESKFRTLARYSIYKNGAKIASVKSGFWPKTASCVFGQKKLVVKTKTRPFSINRDFFLSSPDQEPKLVAVLEVKIPFKHRLEIKYHYIQQGNDIWIPLALTAILISYGD